jgi:dephospho-CoA kinase
MLLAGLTGGLGSGKTTVAEMFRSLGAQVIEADAVAREMMEPGHAVFDSIVEHFGADVVGADGRLDRRKLARRVFQGDRLAELNGIVHPPVIAAQQQWAEEVFARDPQAVAMVESALIFEADRQGSAPGWRQRFQRIVLVTAPVEVRIARYVERMMQAAGCASRAEIEADARSRIAAQIPDSEKTPFADFVIENEGPVEEARLQTERVYAALALEASG